MKLNYFADSPWQGAAKGRCVTDGTDWNPDRARRTKQNQTHIPMKQLPPMSWGRSAMSAMFPTLLAVFRSGLFNPNQRSRRSSVATIRCRPAPWLTLGSMMLCLLAGTFSPPRAAAGSGRVNNDGTIDITINLRFTPTPGILAT